MTQLPEWWLWISAAFFLINGLVLVVVAVLLIQIVKMVRSLQPKVENLVDKVNEVAITVDQVAKDTKLTVEAIGAHSRSLASSVDQIGSAIAGQILRAAPLLNGLLTFTKVFQMFRNMQAPKAKRTSRRTKKDE